MRWILGAIVASAVILGSSDSKAQICTTTTVRAGYQITDQFGWTYGCCRGFTDGGTCVLRSCRVGVSFTPGVGGRYRYDRTFLSSRCLGSYVG